MPGTDDPGYTDRLLSLESRGFRRFVDVQRPYRRRLRRTRPGRTLDIGCGLGRNLLALHDSVGVDHNRDSVEVARRRGLRAWTTEEWAGCPDAVPASFDTLLLSHVLEHLDEATGLEVVSAYLPYLKQEGRLVMVCPQERGYASDATHVRFLDVPELSALARNLGFSTAAGSSFPLPRWAGKHFTYNESWVVASDRRPAPYRQPPDEAVDARGS